MTFNKCIHLVTTTSIVTKILTLTSLILSRAFAPEFLPLPDTQATTNRFCPTLVLPCKEFHKMW